MNHLFSLWLNPRGAVRWYGQSTWLSTLSVSLILTIAYFSSLGLLLVFINRFPSGYELASSRAFWFFLIIFGSIFTLLNIGALIVFFLTKVVGKGSLPETKAAIHCASLSTIPIALFIATFIGNEVFGNYSLFCNIVSLLLIFIFSIYSFLILVMTLAEVHRIKILNAFYITLFGVTFTALISISFVQL